MGGGLLTVNFRGIASFEWSTANRCKCLAITPLLPRCAVLVFIPSGAPVSGQPRGPLCMMGVCFECLVEMYGVSNKQACMLEVTPGMRVRQPSGARLLEVAP